MDLGLTPTDTLSQRTPLMDFTDVIMFSSAAMVYRPLPSGSFNGLLSVVSPSLLAAIGGTLAVVTLVVVCFEVACSWSQTDDDNVLTLAGMCRKGHAKTPSCGSTLLNVLHAVWAALLSEREYLDGLGLPYITLSRFALLKSVAKLEDNQLLSFS